MYLSSVSTWGGAHASAFAKVECMYMCMCVHLCVYAHTCTCMCGGHKNALNWNPALLFFSFFIALHFSLLPSFPFFTAFSSILFVLFYFFFKNFFSVFIILGLCRASSIPLFDIITLHLKVYRNIL